VTSFFEALHVLITLTMPLDRALGEHIAITVLLRKLIYKFFEQLKQKHSISFANTIGLLVCFTHIRHQTVAKACIGFSVNARRQKAQVRRRVGNLPELVSVNKHGKKWRPGNCAEAETFAHISDFREDIQRRAQRAEAGSGTGRPVITSLSLALNMAKGERKPFCEQCEQLAGKLSPKVIDMCPK
jgi:hypothetical protein